MGEKSTKGPRLQGTNTKDFERALPAWKLAIGARNVHVDDAHVARAENATFYTAQRVRAVLYPRTRAEVQRCVKIANRFSISVYAVSTGKNWGYGSRVPYRDGAVVIELGRMKKIVDFDEHLGFITVEPGVTFDEVDAFLRKKKSLLFMSVPGSTRHASPIGNAVERGLGNGPLGDRSANACAMEVVLASGACVRTGFARLRGAATAQLYRPGLGPSLDGLFSQSDLGIVTQMTFWLAPLPTFLDVLDVNLHRHGSLRHLIDDLQGLHLRGLLTGPTKIYNDYKLLSMGSQYPWRLAGNKTPLRHEVIDMALGGKTTAWRCLHAVGYFDEGQRGPQRRLLMKALTRKGSTVEISDSHDFGSGKPIRDIFRADEIDIQGTYWRKTIPAPQEPHPDRDRCGVIFTSPLVPFEGRHVERAVKIIERTALRAGFEPLITLTMLDPRVVFVVAPLFYDRDVPGEDEKALACSDQTLRLLIAEGYLPYRGGIHVDQKLMVEHKEDAQLREAIADALDPNRILSRGIRYSTVRG